MTARWKIAVTAGVVAATATVAMSAWAGGRSDTPAAAQDDTVPDTTEPDATIDEEDSESNRTITVNGNGSVDVTPDTAHIDMGVQVTGPTSQEVLDQVSEDSQTLVDALKGLGIADDDIQTSGLSLWPQYDDNGQQIDGYQGSVSVSVTARDLDALGEVIDGVSAFVGDNLTLGGIWFSFDDPESVLADARTEAIGNAREKATQFAEAAGAEVGEILKIAEVSAMGNPLIYAEARMEAADAAAASVPIEPGSQELTVDVTVVFEMT